MAVALDALGQYGSTGTAVNVASTGNASLQWNHTCSGSNRLLIVGLSIGVNGGSDSTMGVSVTYNSVAMTAATVAISPGPPTSDIEVHSNNQTAGYAQLFYLIAPASSTSYQVSVNVTATTQDYDIIGNSMSFTGVDQTTGISNAVGIYGSGTSTSNLAVTSAAGNMVVDTLCNGSTISGSTSNQTLEWNDNFGSGSAASNCAQSIGSGASTVNVGYTGFTGDWWALIGANIIAASGSSGNSAPVAWFRA